MMLGMLGGSDLLCKFGCRVLRFMVHLLFLGDRFKLKSALYVYRSPHVRRIVEYTRVVKLVVNFLVGGSGLAFSWLAVFKVR